MANTDSLIHGRLTTKGEAVALANAIHRCLAGKTLADGMSALCNVIAVVAEQYDLDDDTIIRNLRETLEFTRENRETIFTSRN